MKRERKPSFGSTTLLRSSSPGDRALSLHVAKYVKKTYAGGKGRYDRDAFRVNGGRFPALLRRLLSVTLLLTSILALVTVSCSCRSARTRVSGRDGEAGPDSTAVLYTYKIINVYPHDPNAFTQGLVFEDGFLYEGTGLYGRSSLRKVQLETGTVLQTHGLPAVHFGEGIAVHGDRIIQLAWTSYTAFVYDKESFAPLDTFYYPRQGWGITSDGTNLVVSDGSPILRILSPQTFELVDSLRVHDGARVVDQLNELEYVDGKIYANVWQSDRIAIISRETGRVEGWIDLRGLLPANDVTPLTDVLNGIAYDKRGARLFVTGKMWPKLFEIEIIREAVSGSSNAE